MTVADQIAALPRFNFGGAFAALPLIDYTNGQPIRIMNLVVLSQIVRPLSFSATSDNTAVATAVISGTKLVLKGVAVGQTVVHVTTTDLGGAQTSQSFTVTVTAGPPRLANISTRAFVGTGDEVTIAGFILGGSNSPRRIAVRGLGPSTGLAAQALANPKLQLLDKDNNVLASNDNWDFSADEQAIRDAGLNTPSTNEPVLIATVPSSVSGTAYTAIMSGVSNGTGIGLIEVFDLDNEAGATLFNISTRGKVTTGAGVMIGGFIAGGTGTQRVVIRALGPTLGTFGIAGPLADPRIELHDAQGATVATNDDWGSGPDAAELQTRDYDPPDPKEPGLIYNAVGGSGYTVIVQGNPAAPTGVALVEVFAVAP